MMPGQDGLDLLAQVRETSDVPVILLTAKADEGDRVIGLRSGADDYVVEALLDRRAGGASRPCCAGPNTAARRPC